MKLTRHTLIILALFYAVLFNSCKKDNELKINAPYKEVPSIYAVIVPQDKIKMIRINKVFLGEGDANKMAQVADSINYPAGELTVTLGRFDDNGNQVDACPTCPDGSSDKRVVTFRDSMVTTSPGAFNTQQRVYVSGVDLHGTDHKISGKYVLTVKNNRSGNTFTAKSTAVDSVSGYSGLGQPFAPILSTFYTGYPPGTSPSAGSYIDYSEQNRVYTIGYGPATETGSIYQVVLRMYFYDVHFDGTKEYHYIDYPFANQYLKDYQLISSYKYLTVTFQGKDIFNTASNVLSRMNLSDQIKGRKLYKLEYFIYSSTDDYNDYLQFATPSLNISQNKPLYSNFTNQAALGIFTFRARCTIYKEPSTSFISQFQINPLTCHYLFYNNDESRVGCQ